MYTCVYIYVYMYTYVYTHLGFVPIDLAFLDGMAIRIKKVVRESEGDGECERLSHGHQPHVGESHLHVL